MLAIVVGQWFSFLSLRPGVHFELNTFNMIVERALMTPMNINYGQRIADNVYVRDKQLNDK